MQLLSLVPAAPIPLEGAQISTTVQQARNGDPAAFAAIYDDHAGRVNALCLRMTADPGRASELVQDVFLRVWEKLDTFRGDAAFSTWLHRLAVNVVLQATRADRRRRQRVELADDLPGAAPDRSGRTPDPGLRLDLEHAIAALSPTLREVFLLHDAEGFQHQEIAEMLEIPVGTCRSHLFRARRQLREVLT